MADLVITVANIKPVTGYSKYQGLAGETITAGQPCYLDTSDSDSVKLADADAVATAVVKGISLHAALTDQPIELITGGDLDTGAILTLGIPYVASTTAGGIAPYSDLLIGDFPSLLGFPVTTSRLRVTIVNSGVAKA